MTMQPPSLPTLREIFDAHRGKVSDKWSSYLDEYQRLFGGFQDKPVSLLEIGVQNGGSLEIWAKYFPRARLLTGCDINENCRKLAFEDPRIAVFVGDANSDAIQDAIVRRSADFDLIIDDGSHRSGDIVKSFARYFPLLKPGGIFLAEDLHCSYWRDFEGGLFDPLSSIAFFKDLSDIVNHEHWGIPEARKALLETYAIAYGVEFPEQVLAGIQSVEFLNSICVVRKKEDVEIGLGVRCRSGVTAEVFAPEESAAESGAPDQRGNPWSRAELFRERTAAAGTAKEISDLNAEIGRLIREGEERLVRLAEAVFESRQAVRQIEKLQHTLALRESSLSWKLTAPLRALGDILSRKK